MKKLVLISLIVLALVGLGLAVGATCGGPVFVVNGAHGAVTGLNATPANVFGKMWVYGAGATKNSGAARAAVSGGAGCADVGTTTEPYWDFSGCLAGYGIYGDTEFATVFLNGCPASGERVVVLFQDTAGNYGLLSNVDTVSTWDMDPVAEFAATPYPRILNTTRTSAPGVSPIVFNVQLTGTPADGLGHYASAPAGAIITGYQIYYLNTNSAPSLPITWGSWTAATNGTISGATTTTATGVSVPAPTAGNTMYLAVRMTFESNITADYVSAVYPAFGPTASPLFSEVSAAPSTTGTTVNWTSGTETQVASYQVYWSATATGTYRTAGQPIAAQGSGRSYTTDVRVITTLRNYFVKVRANKTDGSFEWSAPVQVIAPSKTTSGGMNQGPVTR